MGAELCELNPTHISWKTQTMSCILNLRSRYLCQQHVTDLDKRKRGGSTFVKHAALKSDAKSLHWDFGSGRVFLNLFTSERQHWRRRKTLQGWVALWGGGLHWNVWQRLSIETGIQFIIWAVIRRRGKKHSEWGLLIHLVIFPPIFHCIISVITHTSLVSTMMKSLFWLASFCLITFNEQ